MRLVELTSVAFLFLCRQCASGETVAPLRVVAGQTVRLHSNITTLYENYHVLWSVNSETLVLYEKGMLQLDSPMRFQGRLHVDNVTGSVNISDLRVEDCGIYDGQIINGDDIVHMVHYNVTVLRADPIDLNDPVNTTAGPEHPAAQRSHMALGICFGIFICVCIGLFIKEQCPRTM